MKERFVTWNPNTSSRQRLGQITTILDGYAKMGIRVTLRQTYYRLVAAGIIGNNVREYKNLGNLLSKARLAGLIDWRIIEDRARAPERDGQWDTIQSFVDPEYFRLPRWDDQPKYVELWCEKDAISSVLAPITSELHATLMINRGYSSSSAMYDASKRITREAGDRDAHIIYLGDFDPSGEDMVRDIRDRLTTFGIDVTVTKLALTPEQVEEYNPPPNPVKHTDARAAGFSDKHGDECYEVDALPPEVLQKLVRDAITEHMDMDAYQEVQEREDALKEKLLKAVARIK